MKNVFAFNVMKVGFLTTPNEVDISSDTLIKTRYVIAQNIRADGPTGMTPTHRVRN